MANRFDYNRNFPREFGREPQLRRFMENLAQEGAQRARDMAPDSGDPDDVDYKPSIEGVVDTSGDDVVGRINANDWKSLLIEVHGVNDGRGPLAVLRKAAESLNLRVERGRR